MIVTQLITSFLGSLGFALIFRVGKKYLPESALGGVLCWGTYLLGEALGLGSFFACIAAAAVSTLYSELLARILKAPTTIFLIPSVVPLIPGSSLYYTMYSVVSGDLEQFRSYGIETAVIAFGMAAGISLISAIFAILTLIKKKSNTR